MAEKRKLPNSAAEGAVAVADEVPIDLRRTTLVVDDIDNVIILPRCYWHESNLRQNHY